ncbi:MAG: hypothetical protein L3J83_08790 [Proteobacteria bacterium]|nr:hypothetical protein [Pseudomonadota bacterium]
MKKISVTLLLLNVLVSASAMDGPEEVANKILQDRVAILPRSGLNHDSVFYKEFEILLYTAGLETKDKNIKALLALKALRSIPVLLKEGEKLPTQSEKMKVLNSDPNYILLKKWFFQLTKEK